MIINNQLILMLILINVIFLILLFNKNKETFATMFGDSTFDFKCLNTSI